MMDGAPGNLMPTGIGSLPHEDAAGALDFVRTQVPEIPFWPQLPRRCPLEEMKRQFLPGLPGVVCEDRLRISLARGREEAAGLFEAVIQDDAWVCPPEDRAAGLYGYTRRRWSGARATKGQLIGPVSLGLSLVDERDVPILYSAEMADWLVNHLALAARWQQGLLARLGHPTLVSFDEPYMAAYGSAHFPFSGEAVRNALRGVTEGLKGNRGVHCCGNTDWSLILDLGFDVVSFDAYGYGIQFCLYGDEAGRFLRSGGVLAWGIVPVDEDAYSVSSVELVEQWKDLAGQLAVRAGLTQRDIARSSLVTPACGLGTGDVALAERVFTLLREVSNRLREDLL